MSEEKTQVELLKEKLCMKFEHAKADVLKAADEYCEGYKTFLDEQKTEREIAIFTKQIAEEKGFTEFDPYADYKAGDRVYLVNRDKSVILCVFGTKPLTEGVRISAAHIDSPRLDLRPKPLYEDADIALFKTRYYGGIKKYQWTAIPLALHGVVVKADGSKVSVSIGDKNGEPQFIISDLLPHLAQEQMKRTLSEGVKGEELNIIVGSRPFNNEEGSELVKLNILNILNEKYGITEADFLSAELEMVPAMGVADIGFDRSLIGGYGHDDRVCAYPALTATLETVNPEYTCVCVLTDKEETGSDGNTGLCSQYLEHFIADIARIYGLAARDVLRKSVCLSADVNAAYDPTFAGAFERMNASYLNRGVVVTKYTGGRGKGGTSDASAEYMGQIRKLFDENNVMWQTGELGTADLGGGGTVAKYIANMNVDVVDVGVPVISMHAPYEVVAKLDVYMAYKAFYTFFNKGM